MKALIQPNFFAKTTITIVLTILICSMVHAQEFNCDVTINRERLTNAAFNYLDELEPAIESYINEWQWTEEEYLEQERIDCQMLITFNTGSNDFRFGTEIIINARRPIYNTVNQTTTFIVNDKFWGFDYTQGTNLIHDLLQFNELVSLLDYYCYLLLAIDYDTFAPLGGTPMLVFAQNVLDTAQSTGAIGWDRNSNNRRNRYFLVTDLLNPQYEPYRNALYKYYRDGLDNFTTDVVASRRSILDSIKLIQRTQRSTTNIYLYDLFFDAKSKEIASIFTDAETRVRLEAYSVLRLVDQSHLTDYEVLQN